MISVIASLPILLVVILMVAFNVPAKKALPSGWAAALLVALFVWKQEPVTTAAWALDGFLEAIGTFAIIFGAILIMNTMNRSGAIASIQKMFYGINPDRRIQAIIVGFVFEAFLEGAAGFGTPAALAAPLLISLGFPALCAAIITLIFNTTPVSFGAVGIPTNMALTVTSQLVDDAGISHDAFAAGLCKFTAIGHSVCCGFVIFAGIFVMCKFFGKEKRGSDAFKALPFILFTTAVFDTFYLCLASIFGPEFPSLIGSIMTLAIVIPAAKRNFLCPKENWDFEKSAQAAETTKSEAETESEAESATPIRKGAISTLLAWAPYIIIAVLLVASRLNLFSMKTLLTRGWFHATVTDILGKAGVTWNWNFGWCPGVFPLLFVCILTFFLYRMPTKEVTFVFRNTVKQTAGAAIALCFGVSTVFIYRNTGMNATLTADSMLYAMANGLAQLMHGAYIAVAPAIGALGAFMSGSNTVSNTLFAGLQFQTALLVNLSPIVIVALQNIGAAAGNMICVNNIVAVCATTGVSGSEGRIIRTNITPCIVYCLIAVLILAPFA